MEGEGQEKPAVRPRRRSSVTADKRMSLHLQRMADEQPDMQERTTRAMSTQKQSLVAPSVHSAASVRSAIQEPVGSLATFSHEFRIQLK